MGDLLRNLDDWLLASIFEPFCSWAHRWFGISPRAFERFWLCCAIAELCSKELATRRWLFLFPAFGALLQGIYSVIRPVYSGDVRNPLRIPKALRAASFLAAFVLLYIDTVDPRFSYWYEFLKLAEYFAACDDLPPGTSKVRQIIKSAMAIRLRPPMLHPPEGVKQ